MWSTATGGTTSPGTGPQHDHTTGSSNGHYIYLEGTDKPIGTKSELTSTTVKLDGTFCFTFWYHMFGKGMGTLNVYIKSGNRSTKYWSQSGSQGDNWKFVKFDILSSKPYSIIFEGIRGDKFTSDIAIDDISLLQSSCSGSTNYSQSCLNTATSISLPECSKYYLQLNNLVFDKEFDNCSLEYQDVQGLIKTLCDDVDNSDICTINLSEVVKKESRCFQSKRLLVEYTCEEREPNILSDNSQKTKVPLGRGLVVGIVVAIVLLLCVCVLIICIVRRQILCRKSKEKQKTGLDNSDNVANQSVSLTSGTAKRNNKNVKSIGTNDNQCNMQMNENTSIIKGLKQKTDPTNLSKGLHQHETRFTGSESYALANPTSSSENIQKLKTEQDNIYCQSEEGTYDISGCNRHKEADGNIYSHTVDDVYDSTTHKRSVDDQEDKYDHFIGQKQKICMIFQ
ncbi:uncharacterized protein LOC127707514 [Mytilus californianus]|uniref:uncharacterized protein LOC127707514 n=1 Tax=Mytilus californianus TaxID=6549 RepID=UPI00224654E1|nr:uncharacterized protein LOC127707514 [Mytilus californianus]